MCMFKDECENAKDRCDNYNPTFKLECGLYKPLTTQKDKADARCNDGLSGEQVLAEMKIWIKDKKAMKENDNRKLDKGYKYALDDIYDKIDEIKGAT